MRGHMGAACYARAMVGVACMLLIIEEKEAEE